jgi:hypothetical protein
MWMFHSVLFGQGTRQFLSKNSMSVCPLTWGSASAIGIGSTAQGCQDDGLKYCQSSSLYIQSQVSLSSYEDIHQFYIKLYV